MAQDAQELIPAGDARLVDLMEEQRNVQIVHEQRIASLETRTTVIEVKQGQLEGAMSKLADVMAVQARQATLNEAAIVAIKERTDDHNSQIKELTAGHVAMKEEVGEIRSKFGVIWRVLATVGGAGVLVALEYIFSRFFPH